MSTEFPKILVVDGEAIITRTEAFVPALMAAFEKAGFPAERMIANAEAYARLNLEYVPSKGDANYPVLAVQANKAFNPENVGLMIVRMGHTRGLSEDGAINEIVNKSGLKIEGGGSQLIREIYYARDRDLEALKACFALRQQGKKVPEELKNRENGPVGGGERHTINRTPIPWIIGVTAGQLNMDSRMADDYDIVHGVYQQRLPGYNIQQPESVSSVLFHADRDRKFEVLTTRIRTEDRVTPHQETVDRIIQAAYQLLGDPAQAPG